MKYPFHDCLQEWRNRDQNDHLVLHRHEVISLLEEFEEVKNV